ncbi:hypothetical protein [Acinetobacter rathckeae]|uniref:hypothetical protein n=1 Tax=Acinetobacter rathckeae TaxID=2605272 RepID=UPI0018A2D9B2|nr:hypothetical protein [Acinetobacter rathckeae]MBF7696210.1 hypothetical protein [Acinetobacter rathckeae]
MIQSNPILLNQLKNDYLAIQQQGSPLLACQGMLVPRGEMQDMRFLIKGSMRPIVSNGDPAEVAYAGGFMGLVAGVPHTKYSGNLQMIVTEAGHDQKFAEYIVASGGMIDCDYYDGRVDSFTAVYELLNCAIRFEQAEFDSESKSQVMHISCPCDYNYFGNFASIGKNGTVRAGALNVSGAQSLTNRVQSVINTARAATGIANTINGVARSIGSLFG